VRPRSLYHLQQRCHEQLARSLRAQISPRIKGSLPELVSRKVERELGRYCENRIPPHVRDQIKMEFKIRGNWVTLIERRPPWRPERSPEWTSSPVAQIRFEDGNWMLYWADRDSKWHP
jgi:hypothetical protein